VFLRLLHAAAADAVAGQRRRSAATRQIVGVGAMGLPSMLPVRRAGVGGELEAGVVEQTSS